MLSESQAQMPTEQQQGLSSLQPCDPQTDPPGGIFGSAR
jgi:hypothetical protein